MRACFAISGVTRPADRVFQCKKRVFHPGVADLFKAVVVKGPNAHSIKILRDDRVIGIRQLKPIHRLVAIVARVCSCRQTHLCSGASKLYHALDFSNNDIGAWHRRVRSGGASQGRHHHRFRFAIDKLIDLNRSHRRTHGDSSNGRSSLSGLA